MTRCPNQPQKLDRQGGLLYTIPMRVFISLLLLTNTLFAAVEDRAQLFSPAAVARANKDLDKIKAATKKDILILTVVDTGSKPLKIFSHDEAVSRRLNGAIIVITKNPPQLEVIAGKKTSLVFNFEHRQKVVEILKQNLRKAPDAALASTVKYIGDLFRNANSVLIQADEHRASAQQPNTRVANETSGGGWLKWIIVLLIGFGIFRLIGWFISSRANSAAAAGSSPSTYTGMGGGGFLTSLMGGIFGAVAGNYIYDKFFGSSHHDSNYYRDDSTNYSNSNSNSSNDWRNDDNGDFDVNSGSGGDWGSDSGGGDSGGSDSGGGDSGSDW